MVLACVEKCPRSKCPRFSRCEEHWNADELAEMAPAAPAIAANDRPDRVKPNMEEEKR
jgi:hypothetical protein